MVQAVNGKSLLSATKRLLYLYKGQFFIPAGGEIEQDRNAELRALLT